MEGGRHFQQSAPLIQRSSKSLPFLLQLPWDLFNLLWSVVASLQQPVPHRHDAVNVHIYILSSRRENSINNKLCYMSIWWISAYMNKPFGMAVTSALCVFLIHIRKLDCNSLKVPSQVKQIVWSLIREQNRYIVVDSVYPVTHLTVQAVQTCTQTALRYCKETLNTNNSSQFHHFIIKFKRRYFSSAAEWIFSVKFIYISAFSRRPYPEVHPYK